MNNAWTFITELPWLNIIDVTKSLALIAIPFSAAVITHKFGKIQSDIARRQADTAAISAETARNKLRLDLFDKRHEVYESADKFLRKALTSVSLTSDDRFEYQVSTKPAAWLFEDDISDFFLKELDELVFEITDICEMIAAAPDSQNRHDLMQMRKTQLSSLRAAHISLKEAMVPYLKFH